MKSMTAYANVSKRLKSNTIQIALRSLNFKYLDVHIHNLTPANILLEEKIKREIQRVVPRGKIEVYIFLKGPLIRDIHIEEELLGKYIAKIKQVARKYNLKEDLSIGDFLHLPQVMWWEEKEKEEEKAITGVLKSALNKLVEFKVKEGKVIQKEMLKNIQQLKRNVEEIKKSKPLISAPDSREDIDEEISLMSFYLNKLEKTTYAEKTLSQGKSLDFLTQEILRELNAASSKTKNAKLGAIIVESKNYLERIREQAQNIE